MKLMTFGKIGSGLAAAALVAQPLAAEEAVETTEASAAAEAERANVHRVTRAECLAIEIRDEKVACLVQLRDQQEAEIAARTERVEVKADENAALLVEENEVVEQGEQLAKEEEEVYATIRGLNRVVELQSESAPPVEKATEMPSANEPLQTSFAACRSKDTRDAVKQCLIELRKRQETQIAALDERIADLDAENASLNESIADLDEENAALQERIDQVNATNAVLTKLRDLAREEAERGGPSR